MKNHRSAFTLMCCLIFSSQGLAQSGHPAALENPKIAELIQKLGSSSYVQRERARQELQSIGLPALDSLQRSRKSADHETRQRIDELIRRFEDTLLTQQVLTPKTIHLKLQDATLEEALAELTKASGYGVQFLGDRIPLADRKFTLDTGMTTFWQAVDQFCDQAGLSEKIDLTPSTAPTQVFIGRGRGRLLQTKPSPSVSSPIILTNRSKEKFFTQYAGAVKLQLRLHRDDSSRELEWIFVLSAEPRLLNSALIGSPVLDRTVTRTLQSWMTLLEEPKSVVASGRRFQRMRIQGGPSTGLLENLDGQWAFQCELIDEPLARVEKVLDAAGKSVQGYNGGHMTVNHIRKIGDDVEVKVTMENLTPNLFGSNLFIKGGNVFIQGNVMVQNIAVGPGGPGILGAENHKDVPELRDALGKKIRITSVSSDSTNFVNNAWTRSATILYRCDPGQAEPAELVYSGTRSHMIALPFHFARVMVP